MTTEYTKIRWDDIDPTVFIDDDGQAYLCWGNTQCYYAKLKKNLIELDGPIILIIFPVSRKPLGYINVETGITSLTLRSFPKRFAMQ